MKDVVVKSSCQTDEAAAANEASAGAFHLQLTDELLSHPQLLRVDLFLTDLSWLMSKYVPFSLQARAS